jgi:hypothetical protein
VQSLFQVIKKYAQTLLAQVKCLRSLQFFCTKCVFCLLWVAPGQVAIHVGAKGLPLLPGERARLTIIPVQAQVRLGRVAAKLLILPTTLSHGWQCIQFAYNLHTTCRLCAYIVFSICRLNADFVFVHMEPVSTHKLSPLTPSQCPG